MELIARRYATHVMDRKVSAGTVETYAQEVFIDTPRGPRLTPGISVVVKNHYLSHADMPLTTNALGLRDDELKQPKPVGEKRVLVLGDSIAFGDGVAKTDAWPERVEAALQADGGGDILMVNAGVSGMGLADEVNLLEDKAAQIAPDGIVLGFYLNDSRPSWGFRGELAYRSWLSRHSVAWDQLGRVSALWAWRRRAGADLFAWVGPSKTLRWQNDPQAFQELVNLAALDWGAGWRPEGWAAMQSDFDRLQGIATQRHLPVWMVVFPVAFQVYTDLPEATVNAPQRRALQEAKRRRMIALDLLPELRAHRDQALFYDHCHLTPAGHAVAAAAVRRLIGTTFRRI